MQYTPGQAVEIALMSFRMPRRIPVSTLLIEARDTLRTHGWARGSFCNPLGHYCAMGALHAHQSSTKLLDEAARFLVLAAFEREPQAAGSTLRAVTAAAQSAVMALNDGFMRGESEVLDWFDRAIALAQQNEAVHRPAPSVQLPVLKIADGAHEHTLA